MQLSAVTIGYKFHDCNAGSGFVFLSVTDFAEVLIEFQN